MNRFFFFAGISLACVSAALGQGVVAGQVAETMDSGGYTYVRVVQGRDSTWVAVSQRPVKVGEKVSFAAGMVMNDFTSKTLNRTFKKIVFSDGPASAASSGPEGKHRGAPHVGAPTLAKQVSVKTAKAEGPDGFTVAEVFGRRQELSGKTASVRGKVVKVSLEIMGRNWVHLQDGSGDAKAGTHDLLVTTSETARVGETVTARGTVAKDQDFGAGYRYSALLEKSVLKR